MQYLNATSFFIIIIVAFLCHQYQWWRMENLSQRQNEKITDFSPMLNDKDIVRRKVFALTVDDLFSKEYCEKLINLTEAKGYEQALVNVGFGEQKLMPEYRHSDRCIIDDTQMAGDFWEKIKDYVPKEINDYEVVGLNERMRFLRYDKGGYFKPHCDGSYIRPDGSETSLVTFFLFLNEGYVGGASTFVNPKNKKVIVPCIPKTGRLLLFEHNIYHEGSLLKKGRKYAVRTDIMYKEKAKE